MRNFILIMLIIFSQNLFGQEEFLEDFESEYTVSDKGKVTDKEGKFVDIKREPLKSQYEKYTQAKAIIETSEELTKLQVPQERGQAKQFAEIEKAAVA